jgi:hypothetical protein
VSQRPVEAGEVYRVFAERRPADVEQVLQRARLYEDLGSVAAGFGPGVRAAKWAEPFPVKFQRVVSTGRLIDGLVLLDVIVGAAG